MKGFCPLASGSKGNCTYIASEHTKLLIDAGLSFKQMKDRLALIDVDIEDIDAVIITHEHSDHIKGLKILATKLNIPILANAQTANEIYSQMKIQPKFKIFSTGESFEFGDIHIHPFSIQHDTIDPVAFTLQIDNLKVGICTDLGFASSLVAMHLKECDFLLLESNHDPELVHASSRPMLYKQRVLSRQGHLSNQACGELLSAIFHDKLKHVFLGHLSEDCNEPEIAIQTVQEILAQKDLNVNLSIAHQTKPSSFISF